MLGLKLNHVSKRGHSSQLVVTTLLTKMSGYQYLVERKRCFLVSSKLNWKDGCCCVPGLTYRGINKNVGMMQPIHSNPYSWMGMFEFQINMFKNVWVKISHHRSIMVVMLSDNDPLPEPDDVVTATMIWVMDERYRCDAHVIYEIRISDIYRESPNFLTRGPPRRKFMEREKCGSQFSMYSPCPIS